MDTQATANTLAELGNATRLRLYRTLVRAGDDGLTVGALGQALKLAPSTLAFHLRGLVQEGLVSQHKRGRQVFCFAQLQPLRQLLQTLEQECCSAAEEPNHV